MAVRTARKPALDDPYNKHPEGDPSPASLVPSLPEGFSFTISTNVAIPEKAAAVRASSHPFAAKFSEMGHNDSFFVPLAYFLTREGRTIENTPASKQKDIVGITFNAWRKKGTETEQEGKKKWRLVMVTRDLGEDPEYPNMTGIRAWKVDTSR